MVLPLDRGGFDKPAVLLLVLPVKIIFRVTQIARLTLEIPGSFLPVPQASCLSTPVFVFRRGLLRKQLLRLGWKLWNYPLANGTRPPFTGSHAAAGRARTTFFFVSLPLSGFGAHAFNLKLILTATCNLNVPPEGCTDLPGGTRRCPAIS